MGIAYQGFAPDAALADMHFPDGFALLTYAYSTESVNCVPGKRVPGNFQIPAPAGSERTFVP